MTCRVNCVSRVEYRQNLGGVTSRADTTTEKVIWRSDPVVGPYHYGGQMSFGPDGHIYLTTGDNTKPNLVQPLDHTAGGVFRIHKDGHFLR